MDLDPYNCISSYAEVQTNKVSPAYLKHSGGLSQIFLQDSNRYAGILALPVPCRLAKDYNVHLKSTLYASEPEPGRGRGERLKSRSKECPFRVIVYGLEKEKGLVGSVLSDARIFLQHPSAADCSGHVEYRNPHYLLRPSSAMPDLESLSLETRRDDPAESDELSDVARGRLQGIFDCVDTRDIESPRGVIGSGRLRSKLMSHQIVALSMMVERESSDVRRLVFPTLWTPEDPIEGETLQTKYRNVITGASQNRQNPIYGGILADEMGLGKTLSALALICSSLDKLETSRERSETIRCLATLIVCPKSTVMACQAQISKHIHPNQIKSAIYHDANKERLAPYLQDLHLVVTTYETLRSEWEGNGPLCSIKWLRVVLDEAHHIRNRSTKKFKSALGLQAKYRWCLTGTPIHNSFDDFGALLSFLRVESVASKPMFDSWIASPIQKGKPESMHRLKSLVKATCLRRTKTSSTVSIQLSKPLEKIIFVELDKQDQELYKSLQEKTANIAAGLDKGRERQAKSSPSKDGNILTLMNFLRRVCNHGKELLPSKALAFYGATSQVSTLDQKMLQHLGTPSCSLCGADIEGAVHYSKYEDAGATSTLCAIPKADDDIGIPSGSLATPP